jgi:AcrR family transcriptional regulator
MDKQAQATTRQLILDTAERLFAEHGLDATSVRDITGAAGVNLGAITYHFGTKQNLIAAMFNRHFGPSVERTVKLIEEAQQKPASIEALLEALIRPIVEGSFSVGEKRNVPFMRLMGRWQSEPSPKIQRLIRSHMQPVFSRFMIAVQHVLPELPAEELFWRIQFVTGATHRALLVLSREDLPLPKALKKLNAEGLLRRLVAFGAEGIKAPRTVDAIAANLGGVRRDLSSSLLQKRSTPPKEKQP